MTLQFAIDSPSYRVDSHDIGGYVKFVNYTTNDDAITYHTFPKETLHLVVTDESGKEIVNQSMIFAFSPPDPNEQHNLVVPSGKTEELGFVWLGQLPPSKQKAGKYKLRVEASWPGLPKIASNDAEFELR